MTFTRCFVLYSILLVIGAGCVKTRMLTRQHLAQLDGYRAGSETSIHLAGEEQVVFDHTVRLKLTADGLPSVSESNRYLRIDIYDGQFRGVTVDGKPPEVLLPLDAIHAIEVKQLDVFKTALVSIAVPLGVITAVVVYSLATTAANGMFWSL